MRCAAPSASSAPTTAQVRASNRRVTALRPASFARLMILCAVPPCVVDDLVIVPDRDQGVPRKHRLRIRIRFVLRVAHSVVLERHNLTEGFRNSPELLGTFRRVLAQRVLVDVVAEVDDRVEIVAIRNLTIDVEETCRMVRTADNGESRSIHGT